ncbi:MAG: DUF4349 domain-containing protein [Vicinamibacteria bacterium]
MTRRPAFALTLALALAVTVVPGCGAKSTADRQEPAARPAPEQARLQMQGGAAPQEKAAFAETAPAGPGAPADEAPAPSAARKLIRRGQLTLEVADFAKGVADATRIAQAHGGYVADSQSSVAPNGRRSGTLTLRVAADRFDAAVAELKPLGRVESEGVSSEDVTRAYTDLETRLRIKREAEARIRQILRERTAKLSDVLDAERELSRLVEEIEVAEGQRRFYDHEIALSTLQLNLREPESVVRPGLLDPIVEALRDSLATLSESVAALVSVSVFAAPWLLVFWGVFRLLRRSWRRRRAGFEPRPPAKAPGA